MRFTSKAGNLSCGSQWQWLGQWVLDRQHRPCDEDGWWYAVDWESLSAAVTLGTLAEQTMMSRRQRYELRKKRAVHTFRRAVPTTNIRQRKWLRVRIRGR